MPELDELYQQVIIDHGRNPCNFQVNENANAIKEGFNPLCGDRITIYLSHKNGIIEDISFNGSGCAISIASASLMTESVKGKSIEVACNLFDGFHQLLTSGKTEKELGKLTVLRGVNQYPMRVKCATLAWHTFNGALKNATTIITTE